MKLVLIPQKNEIRIGDGKHTWKDLKIAGADQAAIQALIDKAEDKVSVLLVEGNENGNKQALPIFKEICMKINNKIK